MKASKVDVTNHTGHGGREYVSVLSDGPERHLGIGSRIEELDKALAFQAEELDRLRSRAEYVLTHENNDVPGREQTIAAPRFESSMSPAAEGLAALTTFVVKNTAAIQDIIARLDP